MDSDEVDELSLLIISSVTMVLRSLDELNSPVLLASSPRATSEIAEEPPFDATISVAVIKLVVSVAAFIDEEADDTDVDMDVSVETRLTNNNRSPSDPESFFSPVSSRVPELAWPDDACLLA